MSARRSARRAATPGSRAQLLSNELPPDLAMGPCIEVWADRATDVAAGSAPWMRARRAWARAVDEWAVETGWASGRRPAMNARNLARYRLPWSREFLLARGESEFVAWLEGRRTTNPGRGAAPWSPTS